MKQRTNQLNADLHRQLAGIAEEAEIQAIAARVSGGADAQTLVRSRLWDMPFALPVDGCQIRVADVMLPVWVSREEADRAAAEAVAALTRQRREILLRRYGYCQSVAETAYAMGLPEFWVRIQLQLSKWALHRYLSGVFAMPAMQVGRVPG